MNTGTNSQAFRVMRWLLVVPAYLLASLVGYVVSGFTFSLGWMGFSNSLRLVESTDMQEMWIDGTWFILLVRAISSALGLCAAMYVAPIAKQQTGIVILSVVAATLVVAGIIAVIWTPQPLSFSWWYRSLLEVIGIIAGGVFAIHSWRRPRQANGAA